MQVVKIELPKTLKSVELHTFADLHIGDKFCDMQDIIQRIEYIKNTPNAYVLLNGDICNTAIKTSVSDIYSEQLSPMQQLELFIKLFEPIKDRILSATNGNHENRIYKNDGIDLTALACKELGAIDRYSTSGVALFLKVGEHRVNSQKTAPIVYSIYQIHGSGGGRREGGKANRLADLSSIIDTDIYLSGHTHLPMIFRESFIRTDMSNCCIKQVDKLFVNNSAELEYGGYGEQFAFKPSSKVCPVIYLSGTEKQMWAKV